MFRIGKKLLWSIGLLLFAYGVVSILVVQQWSFTDQGRLPPKTAVLLHAINNQLVTLNTEPPRFLTESSRLDTVVLKENHEIPVAGNQQIPARVYRPVGDDSKPIVMYYHGGAFMEGYGSIDTHENVARSLSERTESIVVSVGYRLAPEYAFPTAVEDGYAALEWATRNAQQWNGDPESVAVAGDSAGGNIATVVAAMARDRNGPDLKAQVLFYPVTTFQEVSFPSRDHYASDYYLLSPVVMQQARKYYTPDESMWQSPYTSPLHAEDLSGLPPAYIVTAEFDPLRDEGEAYAKRLSQFDVPVERVRYSGVMHGFISFFEVMYRGRHGLEESALFLERAFSDDIPPHLYEQKVVEVPWNLDKVRDQAEAYVLAGFLLGKENLERVQEYMDEHVRRG